METPKINVLKDYDGVFEHRVKTAIELNQKAGKAMVENITIDAGPYRSYCFGFEVDGNTASLDFYAASRVFGFEHTIEDIAEAILKP